MLACQDPIDRFRALEQWFASPLGKDIAQAFDTELAHLKQLLHGEIMLQLGSGSENLWFSSLRFQHKWLAMTHFDPNKATLVTKLNQLPLDRDSVDCIIAPLALEAFTHLENPIDEWDRVLKPMGYLVFLGINPLSLWGGWLRYSKNACFNGAAGYPKSVFSIKRALIHRGYMQCHFNAFYYAPPAKTEKWRRRLQILNVIGKMISPMPAGFYCLVVQKYVESDALPEPEAADLLIDSTPIFRAQCRNPHQ
ncbi:methyl-transferase [Legionella rubrilucens]|uniref:Methyl-transferase n=1 Tax=Legionella rubrilucens TaxID=458 RepID=A0A0W0Y6V7_9GAMM|nr:methyltransferase domain-containing protein [Legionella rubrilucens]KTD52418.1 methyl-transferase [Legionella rubrilucens]